MKGLLNRVLREGNLTFMLNLSPESPTRVYLYIYLDTNYLQEIHLNSNGALPFMIGIMICHQTIDA